MSNKIVDFPQSQSQETLGVQVAAPGFLYMESH